MYRTSLHGKKLEMATNDFDEVCERIRKMCAATASIDPDDLLQEMYARTWEAITDYYNQNDEQMPIGNLINTIKYLLPNTALDIRKSRAALSTPAGEYRKAVRSFDDDFAEKDKCTETAQQYIFGTAYIDLDARIEEDDGDSKSVADSISDTAPTPEMILTESALYVDVEIYIASQTDEETAHDIVSSALEDTKPRTAAGRKYIHNLNRLQPSAGNRKPHLSANAEKANKYLHSIINGDNVSHE